MTEAQKAEVQAMYAQLQKLDEDMKSRTESKQQSLVKPILDEVNNAVKQVRKEEGFVLILNSASVVDFEPSANVSDKVLKKLGIADPVAARKQMHEKNAVHTGKKPVHKKDSGFAAGKKKAGKDAASNLSSDTKTATAAA